VLPVRVFTKLLPGAAIVATAVPVAVVGVCVGAVALGVVAAAGGSCSLIAQVNGSQFC
jgi:hypothetical protein